MFTTYNLLLLAEESVTLQGLIELALRDVRKDLILSFISGAVRDSEKENAGIYIFCTYNAMLHTEFNLFFNQRDFHAEQSRA